VPMQTWLRSRRASWESMAAQVISLAHTRAASATGMATMEESLSGLCEPRHRRLPRSGSRHDRRNRISALTPDARTKS
jgi:hypothetical protein